jgi:hypothetical protein
MCSASDRVAHSNAILRQRINYDDLQKVQSHASDSLILIADTDYITGFLIVNRKLEHARSIRRPSRLVHGTCWA